ncbi:MAG: sigma-70 family RNA polymerase sigma factor [Mariniblastus sp.]
MAEPNEDELLRQDMKSITLLLNQAKTGCDESRDRVFELLQPDMERMARRYADIKHRHKAGVSDIVQRSFVKLFENFGSVKANSGAMIRGWIKSVVRNEAKQVSRGFRTQRRDISREQSVGDQGGVEAILNAVDPTPASEAIRKEQLEAVQKAISRLSEDDQKVIRLRTFENKTDEEMVELMGRSKDAVNKLWSRAINKLRKIMLADEQRRQ